MGTPTKIATCCYCGTRAALVLRGETRHELACSRCGAPLRDLKALPVQPDARLQCRSGPAPDWSRPAPVQKRSPLGGEAKLALRRGWRRPKKKRKGFLAYLVEEAFDAVEDIFD